MIFALMEIYAAFNANFIWTFRDNSSFSYSVL